MQLPFIAGSDGTPKGRLLFSLAALTVFSVFLVQPAFTASKNPVCVRDDLHRQVCISSVPKRVISLAPSLTEIVFDLGAGPLLVGRTARCNVPREATKVADVGEYTNPDLERIMSLKPDLVLAPRIGVRREFVDRLAAMDIPVFVDGSKSLDGIMDMVARVGALMGKETEAEKIVSKMRKRRDALRQNLAGAGERPVLLAIGLHPLVVAGGASFLGSLIREAGGTNIAEHETLPYPKFSMEEVIRRDPDVIIVLNKECKGTECFEDWQRHRSLKAVRENRIYQVDADLMSRPAPRIVEGLEQLAAIIHPEIMAKRVSGNEDTHR